MEVVPSIESYAGPKKDKYVWLKWTMAALIAVLNGYAAVMMYASGEWVFALLDLVVVSVGLYVFMNKKTYAHRYIFPGVAGMVVFIIFPLAYTIGIAFTNYSGSNLLSLEQARDFHLKKIYKVTGGEFDFTLLGGENNQFQLLLQQDDQSFISQPLTLLNNKSRELAVREGRVHDEPQVVQLQPLNGEAIDQAAPIRAIVDHRTHLSALDLVLPEGNIHLTLSSLRKFAAQKPLYTQLVDGAVLKSGVVIKDGNLLRDNQSGELMLPNGDTGFYQYIDAEGHFVGKGIAPGFVVSVGWKNFVRIMTDPGIQGPFMQIFVWTVIFSACSVAFTLAIGMVMACLVQWEQLRGRGFYRVMLILPYAIPAFISILVFKGLFNQNFGEINLFLEAAFGIKPDWYTTPFLAKVMILIVNTWLGYPYMMILCMGLLKAIPEDLYEASAMDGAGPVQNFFKITVPLLMKPLTPLLIASFAFNFNNFVLIQLLTNGAPDIIGASTPAGTTDLLVNYTYRIAFQGSGGQDYGLASAIATAIFLIVGALALLNLKLSKADKL
ncbi:maltose ABC transporter permease MalF [Aeromonas media]|uniref:Maltose/maltodextrin transport system permease protein n=1 Tax=Aeromonas media TaxID=651 RepID=A0ABX6NX71_AERME|nr:maltose ABC transporter permease MalF [Aeromonas media]MBS4639615.1 maltose ABC transporter permease MalF [Aeromonas media]QJT34238.1 maltose ABC transporter permease MalF [Aeromonas media]QJT39815.1 maltose ABC transporter permease MalF [Aeromonas media]